MKKIFFGISLLLIFTLTNCSEEKPSVIVLGFDGITFDIAERWIEDSKLPNFKKVIENGSSGRLISTIPFVSPSAWTSAVTGVNPGKHSIYSFVRNVTFEKGEGVAHLNLSSDRKAEAIWELIERKNLKSLLVNIPHTSPPEKVNGVMISGEPHADSDHPEETSKNYTYPEEIKDRFPNYRIDPSGIEYNPEEPGSYFSDRIDIAKRREKTMMDLMKHDNFDLTWVVFTATDKIQHHYWKYMDTTHVLYKRDEGEKYGDAILKTYQLMDSILGRVIDYSGENTTIVVLSDHGFSPLKKAINTENFIRERLPRDYRQWVIAYDYVSPVFKINTPPSGGKALYRKVRDKLVEELKNLKDPSTGNPVNKRVFTTGELYSGPWLNVGPDVIVWPDTNYRYIGYKADPEKEVIMDLKPDEFNGYHERDGVILIHGKNIKNNVRLENPDITDVTPTLLYLLKQPVPGDLDGKILRSAIKKEYLKNNPPEYGGHSVRYPADRDAEEKLKSLDYL